MRIGDLAAAARVSTRALRYYEEQGLLTPARSPGGHRHYPPDAVQRVEWIQRLFAAGLNSKAILGLPPCSDSDSDVAATHHRLTAARSRIDAQLRDLATTRAALDRLITEVERRWTHHHDPLPDPSVS